jgi:outer membrane protein assembly factor BamA
MRMTKSAHKEPRRRHARAPDLLDPCGDGPHAGDNAAVGGARGWAPPAISALRHVILATAVAAACGLMGGRATAAGATGAAQGEAPEGPRVEGVSWSGVTAFSQSDLERAAGLLPGRAVTRQGMEAAATAVADAYRAQGYLNAAVNVRTVERDGGRWLRVDVDEGSRFVIGEVTLVGVKEFRAEDLIEICPGLKAGAAFTREGLESSFERLLRAYGTRGYAECRVSPRSFSPKDAGSVDLALEIVEGRRRVIEGIGVSGGRTKASTAAKLARVETGTAFDPWRLDEVKARLASSGLFSEVGDPTVRAGTADSLVMIEVPVTEPPSSSVSGLLGYAGRGGGAVGFVDLALGNIMGTGRSGGFRWERSGGGLSSYGAGYTEPWLGGLPLSLGLGLEHVTQDTTYSTTALKADVRVTARRGLSFALGVGHERTAIAIPAGPGVTHRTRLALRAGVELDARDNAVDPREGLLLGVDGDWGHRRDGGPGYVEEDVWNITKVRVRSEVYRRLRGRHGLYVGACWRTVMTNESETPWDQLLRFGGASSIRGYREDQFRAEETGLLQIEHRVALDEAGSRIFLFADLGYARGRGAPPGTLLGYGVGIRTAAAGGVLGLDFAMGRGDSWSDGKVHVRMKRTF